MNKKQFYQLRHNIRASGWSWNGGNQLTKPDDWSRSCKMGRSMITGVAKTPTIALVAKTLDAGYNKPKDMDLNATDSGKYMRLVNEWKQYKRLKVGGRSKIWWQNFIRSNVRNDRAVFTHQLTSW